MQVKFLRDHSKWLAGDKYDTTPQLAEYWQRVGVAEIVEGEVKEEKPIVATKEEKVKHKKTK